MGEKAATAEIMTCCMTQSSFGSGNGNDGYNFMISKSCPTAGFTKRSNHTKELIWTFEVDHVSWNNRRKHAYIAL